MALIANLALQVPALPNNDVWFANSAAWTNYWQNINLTATFNPAATTIYVPSPFDVTAAVEDLIIDGVDNYLPSLDQFNSLKAQLAALDASYQDLRTQLKTAGFITLSQ